MTFTSDIKTSIRDSSFRDLLAGSSAALVFKVGGSISTFIFTMLMARSFQASDAGIFFLVIAVSEILTMVARLGLPQSIIVFIGRNTALKNYVAVKGSLQTSMKYIIFSSILVGVALTIATLTISKLSKGDANLTPYFLIVPLAILPFALLHLLGNALRGLGHIRYSQFIIFFCPQIIQLLGLVTILNRQSIAAVVWVYVGAGWATAALSYGLWQRQTKSMKAIKGDFSSRLIFATAIPMFITNLLMLVNARTGTFALGILANPADVLVYNVALRISLLSTFALMAVNAYSAPKFAALHAAGEFNKLGRVARQATMLAMVTTFPLVLVIIIFPEIVLSIFGPSLEGSQTVLIILVLGQCINVASGPVGMLLAMTGNEKKLRNIYLYSTLLNITLQIVLIPAFKANGAAVATTTSILSVNLLALCLVHHELGISLFPKFITKMFGFRYDDA